MERHHRDIGLGRDTSQGLGFPDRGLEVPDLIDQAVLQRLPSRPDTATRQRFNLL